MKYLVTGAAGFIGSHLVEALLERGDEVVGLDDLSTGHRSNVEPFASDFELIIGDIRDLETCHKAVAGCDYVLHQAALGSVPRSVADPIRSHEVNTTGTLNMLVAARDAEVSGFVFAASSSYFGDTDVLPKTDSMPPRPLSPYAVTKVTCEQYVRVFANLYDLPALGTRYFNIFGPRQDPNGPYAAVIPKFIELLLNGERPTINGDGEQTRDFTYVENVVNANLSACANAKAAAGNIMNIACGDRISLNTLYKHIAAALELDIEPIYGPPRAGDVRDSLADTSLAAELIGYTPKVDVGEGLARTVEWFTSKQG